MNKLKLHLDELAVESFSVEPAVPPRGTVVGHETYIRCGQYTVDYPLSCDHVCNTYYCTDEVSCAWSACDCTQVSTCQGNQSCGISCAYENTCYTCEQTC
jgi:hypothetical protein